jgi:hypothetical protein
MATTTNYGWSTPDDVSLVKDGASAIRTLGSSADTTVKALNPGTTAGDIDYYTTSTAKARVGIGTAGQVLTVNSGATAPQWATPSSGGMTLIQEQTASANSAIDFTSISGSYDQLLLVWCGIFHSTTATQFGIRFNSDSGSNYMNLGIGFNDGTAADQRGTDTYIQSSGADRPPFGDTTTSNDLGNQVRGQLLIDNYSSTTKLKPYSGEWSYQKAGVGSRTVYNLGTYNSTSAITAVNIFRITGAATMSNSANTSIRLYGIS